MFIRGAIVTYPGEGQREGGAQEQKTGMPKGGQELFLWGHQVYIDVCGASVSTSAILHA